MMSIAQQTGILFVWIALPALTTGEVDGTLSRCKESLSSLIRHLQVGSILTTVGFIEKVYLPSR